MKLFEYFLNGSRPESDRSLFDVGLDVIRKTPGIKEKIADWYRKSYPEEELERDICPLSTWYDLCICLMNGADPYMNILPPDCVVRERVFQRLSEMLGEDYITVYNTYYIDGIRTIHDMPQIQYDYDYKNIRFRGYRGLVLR